MINPPQNCPRRRQTAKAHCQGHLMVHPADDGRGRQVPRHGAEGTLLQLLQVVASARGSPWVDRPL